MAKIVPITGSVVEADKFKVMADSTIAAGKSVRKLYREIDSAVEKIVDKAYSLGAMLLELQREIGHGVFIEYCTDELELNYKKCQRYMDVAQYRTQIEATPQIEDLQDALKVANKVKKDEKETRDKKELVMFETHSGAEAEYAEKLVGAADAKAQAEVPKPVSPWDSVQNPNERRNIGNRYKGWKKKVADEQRAASNVLPTDAKAPSVEELVEAAFQVAMLKLDILTGDELGEAIGMLIDRLTSSDFPEM